MYQTFLSCLPVSVPLRHFGYDKYCGMNVLYKNLGGTLTWGPLGVHSRVYSWVTGQFAAC